MRLMAPSRVTPGQDGSPYNPSTPKEHNYGRQSIHGAEPGASAPHRGGPRGPRQGGLPAGQRGPPQLRQDGRWLAGQAEKKEEAKAETKQAEKKEEAKAETKKKRATADDARKALKAYAAVEGNDAAMELLTSLGAPSVSGLAESSTDEDDKLQQLIDKCAGK